MAQKQIVTFDNLSYYDGKIKTEIDTRIANGINDAAGNYDAAGTAETKVNALADGQVKTNTDNITTNTEAIATLNGSGEGSVDKKVSDAVTAAKTELEGKITDSLYDDTEVKEDISANAEAIATLNGSGEGSVTKTVNDAINQFATNVTDDAVVNSYKELIDYAAEHGEEFTALVGDVTDNTTAIEKNTADIAAVKATADGAVQDVATGATEGTVSVDGTDVAVNGYSDLKTSVTNLETKVGEGFAEITTAEIDSLFA